MSGTIINAAAVAAAGTLLNGLSTLTEAVRTAAIDPADQIRILIDLANYSPTPPYSTAPIGNAIATAFTATAAAARRAALVSLANACASYQPSSYNDALEVRTEVTTLFDAEILVAADNDDDNTVAAFQTLRASVIQDLTARGANLPSLVTVTTPIPMAALPLAYRLYADATRADDIVARADPINPNFCPTSMQLLSS